MDYDTKFGTDEDIVELGGKSDAEPLSFMGAMDIKDKRKIPKGDVNMNLEDNTKNINVNLGEGNLR